MTLRTIHSKMQDHIQKMINASSIMDLQVKALEMYKKQQEDDKKFWNGVSEKLEFLQNGLGPSGGVSSQILQITENLQEIFKNTEELNDKTQSLQQSLRMSKLRLSDTLNQRQKVRQVIQFSTLGEKLSTLPPAGQLMELRKVKDVFRVINSGQQQLLLQKDVDKIAIALFDAIFTQINIFIYQKDIDLHFLEYFAQIGMTQKQIQTLAAQFLAHIMSNMQLEPCQVLEALQQMEKTVNTKQMICYPKLDKIMHDFIQNNQQKMDIIYIAHLYKIFNATEYKISQNDDIFIKIIQQKLHDEIFVHYYDNEQTHKTTELLQQILIQQALTLNTQNANTHLQKLLSELEIKNPHKIRFANSLLGIDTFSQDENNRIIHTIQTISYETLHTLNLYTQDTFKEDEASIYEQLMQWISRQIATIVRKSNQSEQDPIMSRLYALEFTQLYKPENNQEYILNEWREIVKKFISSQMKQQDVQSLVIAVSKLYLILNFKNKEFSIKQTVSEALETQGHNFRTWMLQDSVYMIQFKNIFNSVQTQEFKQVKQNMLQKTIQSVVQYLLDKMLGTQEITQEQLTYLIELQIILQQLGVILYIKDYKIQRQDFEPIYQMFKQQ